MVDRTLSGVYPILYMPFDDRGRIDVEDLRKEVEFVVAAGVAGVGIAMGSEIFKLSEAERDLATGTVVEQARGRVKVVVHTGAEGTDLAVKLSLRAQELGADALMATPPTTIPIDAERVKEYFKRMSDAVDIPIFVQDIPGAAVAPRLVAAIAREAENVCYAKMESPPTPQRVSQAKQYGGEELIVFGGAGGQMLLEELGRGSVGTMPGSAVPVYFIDEPLLFDREGIYQVRGQDHPDNLERFSVLSQAALQILPKLCWQPEIVHCHDWQSSLACAHLRWGPLAKQPFFASMRTVLTIHNLAYQGLFPTDQGALTGLPPSALNDQALGHDGQISLLKGGLMSAGRMTTVSPTYAQEIQTPAFGCGFEAILRRRQRDLVGILNGIDPEEWNPKTDPHLASTYDADSLAGKPLCRQALQQAQRLPDRQDLLIGMVQRLAEQKGIDIFIDAVESLMALPVQLVLLGTGNPIYHEQLERLAKRFPERLAVNLTFNNPLAHQIEAGADAFLMPSRFEPCGLNQMYSMRFGTVPIVRRVGGLVDTVVDLSPATASAKTATGFMFEAYTARAVVTAVRRAVAAFDDQPLWMRLMQSGMRRDFSWEQSARAYVDLYERAMAEEPLNMGPALAPSSRRRGSDPKRR